MPLTRPLIRATLATCLGLAATLGAHGQTLTSYDTFTTANIVPARWYAEEGRQYGGTRVEARRAIADGQLRIEAKTYSDNYSNTQTSTGRNALVFAKSEGITAIRSTVTMRTATAGGCAANTTPSGARARIFGFFFNAGSPVPGSNYNDVYAGIQLHRMSNSTDGAGVLRVFAFVGICTDDSCIASTTLASQDLGTTTLNTPVELQVSWDAANNRFAFQRDAQAAVNLAYTVADTEAASFPVKRLEVSNQVAHCTASRPAVTTWADFDNVKTAAAALAAASMRPAVGAGRAEPSDSVVGHVN